MDASMMQLAMEQMRKMNPEQLQAMMRNMPPDAMNQAMAQMKNMKPEDWDRAKEQLAGMDADTMARQAAQAQAQMTGRTQYVLNASVQLKQEGNQLHNAGSYKEAVEKYERAKSNVEAFTSQEARDLVRACTLNLSSCYLNLKQYGKCVEQCNQVLAAESNNLKALYRRGQAHMGGGSWLEASADLERALKLAAETDPAQAQPIRDKLQEVKDQIGALRASGKLPPAAAAGSGSTAAAAVEEVPKSAPAAAAAAAAVSPSSGSGQAASSAGAGAASSGSARAGGTAVPDADMLARASEMMRSNPDMLKQAQEMMRGMSDEQLAAMSRQMGMEVPPEVVRNSMGDLNPDLMAKVAQMQAELPPDLRGPDAARNPDAMKRLAEHMARKPEMASTMGQMLASMDPAKLQEMSRAAGLPAGVTITPELAKMAAESFQRMSPEEVQAAVQAASSMQPPASTSTSTPSSAAATGDSGAVASNAGRGAAASTSAPAAPFGGGVAGGGMPPVDPRMAAEMLAAMTPEQLEAMTKMVPGGAGMQLTPEMAKMAAQMMKDMTPEDIERMQQMAAAMQQGGSAGGGGGAAAMAAAAAAAGGAASGATLPSAAAAGGGGMAQMAAEMMKNMTPEDMARMQEMAAKMGMGGEGAAGMPAGMMPGMMPGGGGAGGGGMGPDAMAAMMADPKMIETAVRMMKSMDPEAMVSMMMSSGMCRDRAQAEAMARQMGSLSDAQVKMMVRAASAMQGARAAGQRALAWARQNFLLVAAVLVVLFALLLRWLGYM